MTESDIKVICTDIFKSLSEKKLKQAFTLIKKMISETRLGEYSDKVYDLEENYFYIRKYTVDGVDDPERTMIYHHLVRSLIELTVKIRENWMSTQAGSVFYQKKRAGELLPLSDSEQFLKKLAKLQSRDTLEEREENRQIASPITLEYWHEIVQLFYRIALTDEVGEKEKDFIFAVFEDDLVIPECKAVLVTSLTFSLFRYFDETKMKLHLDLFEKNQEMLQISQRCLTGFLLTLYHYESLMEFYPLTVKRFEIMNEDPVFNRKVERIMLQLLASRETEKIKQRIQEDIIPEMIRISPNIRNKFNLDTFLNAESPEDWNPEWSTLFHDSPGLLERMEEMARMQSEGADVFLASFGMFKRFPFFYDLVNWFVPYFPTHPEMPSDKNKDPEDTSTRITEALLQSPMLCNSDKYSFSMMLQSIAGKARAMMADFLQAEMEQLEELGKEEEMMSSDRKEGIVSNQYIQDLYRFFRLSPSGKDFEDIFSWKFDFHNKPAFREVLMQHSEMIGKMAEFYFEKGYYEEALEIFAFSGEQEGVILQKAAWCHQKLGNFQKALSLYQKADLYEVNKTWNLKKIALCYRNLKLPEEALKVYQTLESMEPDNLSTLYAMGYCLSETGRYQEALNAFFKIEYLSPGNKKVWRPIAWCSFLTGKTAQAEKYYRKLMEEQPDKYDLMNMGHVQWVTGKRQQALEYYLLSIHTGDFSVTGFMDAFEEDRHFLIDKGIPRNEIHIVLDQLRYSLEE